MHHSPIINSSSPTSARARPTGMMEGCVLRPPNSQLFSDNVIGGVVQRSTAASRYRSSSPVINNADDGLYASRTRHQGEKTRAYSSNEPTRQRRTDTILSSGSPSTLKLQLSKGLPTPHTVFPGDSRAQQVEPSTRHDQLVAMAELAAAEKLRLRELRRVRQIRYRKKKENYMHTLEDETRQLRDEIKQLEQRQRSASAAVPAKESAWSVAAEYFRLFRYGVSEAATATASSSLLSSRELQSSAQLDFLRASMTPDVTFNSERGIQAMMRTWSCVSRWFTGVEMDLERLDKDAAGSLVATTTTTVTITEQTIRAVFPHLGTRDVRIGSTESVLVERLVGQRISMRGRTRFEWDDAYCRVTSVMSEADMLTPMLRLVGSLEYVSRVFDGALVTPDFRLQSSEKKHGCS